MANGKHFGGGGPVRPYKKINDSTGPTDRDRIRTDDYGEPIRWKDKPVQRKTQSGNASVLNLVSIILVIGLIATVFFAYSNAVNGHSSVLYFSPSSMLESLQSSSVVSGGDYRVYYEKSDKSVVGGNTPLTARYEAYVILDGRKYYSYNDDAFYLDLSNKNYQFYFDINGVFYVSKFPSDEDVLNGSPVWDPDTPNAFYRLVTLPTATVNTLEMPDISVVGEAWSNINDLKGFFNAFSVTGGFIIDSVRYEGQIINNLLPWNYVKFDDYNILPELWEDAESKNGLT